VTQRDRILLDDMLKHHLLKFNLGLLASVRRKALELDLGETVIKVISDDGAGDSITGVRFEVAITFTVVDPEPPT
jgi:hypothetical protein